MIYFAVADEEAGGTHGAEWLAEHAWDAVGADYVLTESGGLLTDTPTGPAVTVTVAEKGIAWRRIRVLGTPAHGSMPFRADNALIKAAEVVRRLAAYRPAAQIGDIWRGYVESRFLPDDVRAALLDPEQVWDACAAHTDPREAKLWHACTHTTFSPNMAHGGVKTNVIPDVVDLDVDIRTLPGETADDVAVHLAAALGDLADDVRVSPIHDGVASRSRQDNPMWATLEQLARDVYPGARLLPRMTTGGTDARVYRERGTVAYGCGLMSRGVTFEQFADRFHGNDEQIDVGSLALTTDLWLGVAERFLG